MSKQIPRTKNKLGLLAFAPFFNLDSSALAVRTQGESIAHGLSRLQYSGEEVLRVKEIYGSNAVAYLGQQASKKVFLEMAGSYDVLHLATHAKANVKAGEFSFLAFAPTDSEPNNSLISVGELYNCSLNASMVVLSACETGLGEEVRGEGVLSLARAFAFAGARSIVCSLWSVNDKSTMRLMDYFYELRGSGQTNSLTLQNAKLKYLKENPGAGAHPFYWAGFVAIGE
jgi:CHAT domain-containing protein